ncbi:MAG: GTP-binding protein [Alphaproteobacteria bacterium]|nr:GTP-binding protein [Alphaproteobacteria bacterium]
MTTPRPAGDAGALLPVSLLTGFLGSGKTTLLRHLLRQKALARAAVIVNELGEVALDDALLLAAGAEPLTLAGGCVCCTVRGDLSRALGDLYVQRAKGEVAYFDRVLIETTGLADPAPILHSLMSDPLLAARFRLDGVIATVDAVHGNRQLDAQPESVKQAALADRLVLTKSDLASPETVAALRKRLRALNPAAPILVAIDGQVEPADLLDAGLYDPARKTADVRRWLKAEAYDDHADHDHAGHDHSAHSAHDARIRAFCLTHDRPIAWDALLDWLEALAALGGPRLLRLKGLIHVRDRENPVVLHGVEQLFHPPVELARWPDEDRRSKLVLITRDLPPEPVAEMFRAFVAGAEA